VRVRVSACLCVGRVSMDAAVGAGGRRTRAQQLRVGVRDALRICVQEDAAADCEPETAGRQGREVHTAAVQLAPDGRQALALGVGFDSIIAWRALLAVRGARRECWTHGAGHGGTTRYDDGSVRHSTACMPQAGDAPCRARMQMRCGSTASHSDAMRCNAYRLLTAARRCAWRRPAADTRCVAAVTVRRAERGHRSLRACNRMGLSASEYTHTYKQTDKETNKQTYVSIHTHTHTHIRAYIAYIAYIHIYT
jgi:hypothetical protein